MTWGERDQFAVALNNLGVHTDRWNTVAEYDHAAGPQFQQSLLS